MAKKKKDNGILGYVLIVLVVLVIFISYVTPFVLLGGYLYCRLKVKTYLPGLKRTASDFWLTEEEKYEFRNTFYELSEAVRIIDDAKQKGEDANLSTNMDGSFSARSNLGKEIRQTLSHYEPLSIQLASRLDELQCIPQDRWDVFNILTVRTKAFFMSFYCWMIALVISAIILSKGISGTILPYIAIPLNLFRDNANSIILLGDDYYMIIGSAAIGMISYFILMSVYKNEGSKITPEPPDVTMENINDF